MAKFCNACGAQLDDNTTFCNNCGAKLEAAPQTTTGAQAPAKASKGLPKLDKNLLKIVIPAAVAVIALIIVISIIVGNAYKKPIKKVVEGVNEQDDEILCDALPDFLIKKYDKADKNYGKNVREKIKNKIKSWEENETYDIGDDPEVSYEILDKIEYTEEELESIKSQIKASYDKKVDVTKGYSVALIITIEGEDGEYSYPEEVSVYKIDGKWSVLDTSFLVSASTSGSNDYDYDIDYDALADYLS